MTPTIALRFALEEPYLATLRATFPAVDFPVCTTAAELAAVIGEADALIGGALDAALLDTAPRLRWATHLALATPHTFPVLGMNLSAFAAQDAGGGLVHVQRVGVEDDAVLFAGGIA